MRPESVYCVTCVCGFLIETHKQETTCAQCKAQIKIDWQATYQPKPAEKGQVA